MKNFCDLPEISKFASLFAAKIYFQKATAVIPEIDGFNEAVIPEIAQQLSGIQD